MNCKTTIRARQIVTALAVSSALASAASAQDAKSPVPAADPMAAYKTDKGLISLTKVAPEMTPVSDYTGDFWTRATLLGDLGSSRTDLYDHGLTLDAQLTQVYQGVTSGGSVNGNGNAEYNGLFEATLTLDTAKAGLWSGGLFVLSGQSSWGDPLQKQAGNLSPVNATALWPEPYNDSTVLMEYYLAQALPFNTVVMVGRLDPSKYLDQNSFACNKDTQFLNVSMNSNTLFGSFLTYSTYALFFLSKASDNLTIAYGAWTPDTVAGDYSGDWKDYGLVLNPQFKYQLCGLPGAVQGIFAYSSKDSTDVGNPRLLQDIQTGTALPTKEDNWIVEIAGEQYFWQPDGAGSKNFQVPTAAFKQDQPGLGIFYRFSWVPEDRNAFNMYASGGIGGRGVIPGRPYDRFGIGPYWLKESSDLDSQPGNVVGDEVGAEVFYNFAITPFAQLSLDAQWISPGIVSSDTAVVLGTRLNIRF